MDNSVMGGGLLQGSGGTILDLDQSMHRHFPPMISQPLDSQLHRQHQLSQVSMTLSSADQSMPFYEPSPSKAAVLLTGMAVPPGVAFRTKLGSSSPSEDDDDHEPSFFSTDDAAPRATRKGGGGGPSTSSPWQRMKWTDDMVRLLISVVACVGDDGVAEDGPVIGSKRKLHGGGSGGVHALQKKGKWKTVAKLMLERGCCVTPQQCEDKFNDLNKRYKRLNDILGRGTTCQVVENPSLLDSVPGVSAKAKDDVRKILASKHLFYREMCAYHHGQRIPNPNEADPVHGCVATGAVVPNLSMKNGGVDADCGGTGGTGANEEEDEGDDDEDGEEQGDDPVGSGRSLDVMGKAAYQSDFFPAQIDAILQDPTKSAWEVQEWIRKRALLLQEERVEIQVEALELEKRRFKWQRFCNKKDRELERMRLENERMGLENERMSMQLRLKATELESGRSASSIGGDFVGSFQA